MENEKVYTVIGMMSGTSFDGIDLALIETDGFSYINVLDRMSAVYKPEARAVIRGALKLTDRQDIVVQTAEKAITEAHINALESFIQKTGLSDSDIDLIGFHGQTIFHDPDNGVTVQIGDAEALAKASGIDTVYDFRSADMAAGGQGAPFLPLYHRALALKDGLDLPLVVANIGGVSNVTWIGGSGDDQILAFDCGPGNALMDDFISAKTGAAYDKGGALAAKGRILDKHLDIWMQVPFFHDVPPKSLDRDAWDVAAADSMALEDGLATLAEFTMRGLQKAQDFFPASPTRWLITGGGRHNDYLMARLNAVMNAPVMSVEDAGWNGDSMEAEGFAYLAVRSIKGLPLSLPNTTGVKAPQTGGVLELF